jgi:hypothetical protein
MSKAWQTLQRTSTRHPSIFQPKLKVKGYPDRVYTTNQIYAIGYPKHKLNRPVKI